MEGEDAPLRNAFVGQVAEHFSVFGPLFELAIGWKVFCIVECTREEIVTTVFEHRIGTTGFFFKAALKVHVLPRDFNEDRGSLCISLFLQKFSHLRDTMTSKNEITIPPLELCSSLQLRR
ncbi:hypothetical protein KI387_024811, partial [Taxus chinensis]